MALITATLKTTMSGSAEVSSLALLLSSTDASFRCFKGILTARTNCDEGGLDGRPKETKEAGVLILKIFCPQRGMLTSIT